MAAPRCEKTLHVYEPGHRPNLGAAFPTHCPLIWVLGWRLYSADEDWLRQGYPPLGTEPVGIRHWPKLCEATRRVAVEIDNAVRWEEQGAGGRRNHNGLET
jgi:hypothetical protein